MKILTACEFSDRVRSAFEKRGHDAWSCDLLPSENKDNKKHYQGDVFDIINDGWDKIIAFPPCTDLTWSNGKYLHEKRKDGRTKRALEFCIKIWNSCDDVVLENPKGDLWEWMKPTQIIHPWMFGDNYLKATCLWIKNKKQLIPIINEEPEDCRYWISVGSKKQKRLGIGKTRDSKDRARTFQGIADAMAEQWG